MCAGAPDNIMNFQQLIRDQYWHRFYLRSISAMAWKSSLVRVFLGRATLCPDPKREWARPARAVSMQKGAKLNCSKPHRKSGCQADEDHHHGVQVGHRRSSSESRTPSKLQAEPALH